MKHLSCESRSYAISVPQTENMQICKYVDSGTIKQLAVPSPDEFIFENIKWGEYDRVFTPAYWKVQTIMSDTSSQKINYKWGTSLSEEVAACILGGYGIPAEMGFAAFLALRNNGILSKESVLNNNLQNRIFTILSADISLNKKKLHYRFARQRSERLSSALKKIETENIPTSDVEFRNWLLTFNGIGPKTASWITRNWFGSDNVAIIDIHIFRACAIMGLFSGKEKIDKDYFKLEKLFLQLVTCMGVCASKLDVIIWSQMRTLTDYGLNRFRGII